MSEKLLARRIAERGFPSVFQAWSPAAEPKGVPPEVMLARHDLIFHAPEFFGLRWNKQPTGLADGFTPESVEVARKRRAELLGRNPSTVLLAEIRYRDAPASYLPEDHTWWKRDKNGKRAPGWEEGGFFLLDFGKPEFRKQVALQAKAATASGAVDGVMLDWWLDDDDRLLLAQELRDAIGPNALLLANANDRQTPRTAPLVNGYFMECYRTKTPADWRRIATTLEWAEKNLRRPRINCVESWWHVSRQDRPLMRLVSTLTLCLSDGYCLFSDPNDLPTADHLHRWYDFWDKSLGKPLGRGAPLGMADKAHPMGWYRDFEHGRVICVLPDAQAFQLELDVPHKSAATGKISKAHTVPPGDGDLLLRV